MRMTQDGQFYLTTLEEDRRVARFLARVAHLYRDDRITDKHDSLFVNFADDWLGKGRVMFCTRWAQLANLACQWGDDLDLNLDCGPRRGSAYQVPSRSYRGKPRSHYVAKQLANRHQAYLELVQKIAPRDLERERVTLCAARDQRVKEELEREVSREINVIELAQERADRAA